MTIVTVQLFARFRDIIGKDAVYMPLEQPTVAELRRTLTERYPPIGDLLERSRVAVNGDFADGPKPLTAEDEVALIPPVSGG